MDIKINAVRFDADQKLIDYINKKLGKVVLFYDAIVGAEVFLKLDNTTSDENKIVEVKLLLPGNEIFASKQSKSFEDALNQVVDVLNRSVTKYKEKLKQ